MTLALVRLSTTWQALPCGWVGPKQEIAARNCSLVGNLSNLGFTGMLMLSACHGKAQCLSIE